MLVAPSKLRNCYSLIWSLYATVPSVTVTYDTHRHAYMRNWYYLSMTCKYIITQLTISALRATLWSCLICCLLRLVPGLACLSTEPCLTPSLVSGTRRRPPSPGSLQLNLNCTGRQEAERSRRQPLLRPLNECEDNLAGLVSARTPLIEADSDRESCV